MTPTVAGRRIQAEPAGEMAALLARRFDLSTDVPHRFFTAHAESISRACLAMARRFDQGGRLLAFGAGAQASDAEHVAVEFVHPVLVGKRALPAIALDADPASLLPRLEALARPHDIVLAIARDAGDPALHSGLALGHSRGLLTIALVGGRDQRRRAPDIDHLFAVDSGDPMVIQETHETLYHVLWELVHLFFEQPVTR